MNVEPIQYENHCYVLLQGLWIHPIATKRHDLVWYPERAMTLLERHQYRPYVKSVVTEDAWIIGLYDRLYVRIIEEDGSWRCPNMQTYAASHNTITCCLLGIQSTIPAMTNDGGETIKKEIENYKKLVDKAWEIY